MNTLIIAGGVLFSKDILLSKINLQSYNLIIAVDHGYNHCLSLGISPNIIIGDFDSAIDFKENHKAKIVKASSIKDETDLRLAIDLVLEKSPSNIDIICATGGRLDHLLGNFSILEYVESVSCKIIDEYNTVSCISGKHTFENTSKYISLLPITDYIIASSDNLLYPMDNTKIFRKTPISISNSSTSQTFSVDISFGKAFLILSND